MSDLLELTKDEVSERFDGPEQFAEALVEEHADKFEQEEIEVNEDKKERLYEMYMDSIKEDEIWE